MRGLKETSIQINGHACRVWEKGEGETLGFLPGIGGLPKWTPFLDGLAEHYRVVAPSLPGFPGGGKRHTDIDDHLGWLLATYDALTGAGLQGEDLIGVSLGAALAADVAAIWPEFVRRLVLVSPLGLFDQNEPTANIFGQKFAQLGKLLCVDEENFKFQAQLPDEVFGEQAVEWQLAQVFAQEAAARMLWPLGDTGLSKRWQRIKQPTLLVRGELDEVLPASYVDKFLQGIGNNASSVEVAGAKHQIDLDMPEHLGEIVMRFLSEHA